MALEDDIRQIKQLEQSLVDLVRQAQGAVAALSILQGPTTPGFQGQTTQSIGNGGGGGASGTAPSLSTIGAASAIMASSNSPAAQSASAQLMSQINAPDWRQLYTESKKKVISQITANQTTSGSRQIGLGKPLSWKNILAMGPPNGPNVYQRDIIEKASYINPTLPGIEEDMQWSSGAFFEGPSSAWPYKPKTPSGWEQFKDSIGNPVVRRLVGFHTLRSVAQSTLNYFSFQNQYNQRPTSIGVPSDAYKITRDIANTTSTIASGIFASAGFQLLNQGGAALGPNSTAAILQARGAPYSPAYMQTLTTGQKAMNIASRVGATAVSLGISAGAAAILYGGANAIEYIAHALPDFDPSWSHPLRFRESRDERKIREDLRLLGRQSRWMGLINVNTGHMLQNRMNRLAAEDTLFGNFGGSEPDSFARSVASLFGLQKSEDQLRQEGAAEVEKRLAAAQQEYKAAQAAAKLGDLTETAAHFAGVENNLGTLQTPTIIRQRNTGAALWYHMFEQQRIATRRFATLNSHRAGIRTGD